MFECPIARAAKHYPSKAALYGENKVFSYQELELEIFKRQKTLKNKGPIPFFAEKSIDTIVTLFACFRLGLSPFPQNPKIPKLYTLKWAPSHSLLLKTSGSSGDPKTAVLSLDNLMWNAWGVIDTLKLSETDRWHLSLPLYHVGGIGILFRAFLVAASIDLSLSSQSTHLSYVPTQLYRALQEKASTAQVILLGGAPCPPNLLQQALDAGFPVVPTYGMTEMGSTVTLSGKLLPFRELKIEGGEILVKGKTLFQGYLQETLIQPFDKEGWFATGDLGLQTSELLILGRKDRLFISGGENIHPEEIEKILLTLPGIEKARVEGVEDKEFGARPVAYLLDRSETWTVENLRENLKNFLPSFKLPIAVHPLWKYVDKKDFS